jgi:hypothetical protein
MTQEQVAGGKMSDSAPQKPLDEQPQRALQRPEDAAADTWSQTLRCLLIFVVTTATPVLLFWLLMRQVGRVAEEFIQHGQWLLR